MSFQGEASSQGSPSRKRPISTLDNASDQDKTELYKSKEILDRSSAFIAAFSPTATPRTLQSLPEFKSASHRILAWRHRTRNQQRTLTGPPRETFDIGYDDDGEKYGGKRAERVLDELKVEGAVVVARWYGGVLLGPVRFAHIENCAREAIESWQRSKRGDLDNPSTESPKRRRLDQGSSPAAAAEKADFRSKEELIQVLAERDESIRVLRALLAEKQGKTNDKTGPKAAQPPKYGDMPIMALRRLEHARDSTLSWILKEIDRVEKATGT